MDVNNFPIRPEYVPKVGKDWPELLLLDVFSSNIHFAFLFCVARLLNAYQVAPPEAGEQGLLLRLVVLGGDEDYKLDVLSPYVDTALILGYSLFLHFEFFINSWCHSWEKKEKKKDDSTPCQGLDFYWVGLLNAGEGT